MTEIRFRQVETTADTGLFIWGHTEGELLENAAVGLFRTLASPKGVRSDVERFVSFRGDDTAGRLVSWLSEWLYLFDTEGFIGRTFVVERASEKSRRGRGYGSILDPGRHVLLCGVKGVTYHGIDVRKVKGRYRARVILDI